MGANSQPSTALKRANVYPDWDHLPVLPAHHRLRDRRAFQRLYQVGQRRSGAGLTLLFHPMPPEMSGIPSQVGFVVSKKLTKSAVRRNRLRRQLREIVRLLCPTLKPGYQLVLIAKASVLSWRWQQLQAEVQQLLQKAGLLVVEPQERVQPPDQPDQQDLQQDLQPQDPG